VPVSLKDVLDALPPKRRAELDQRFKELVNEVESLKELGEFPRSRRPRSRRPSRLANRLYPRLRDRRTCICLRFAAMSRR